VKVLDTVGVKEKEVGRGVRVEEREEREEMEGVGEPDKEGLGVASTVEVGVVASEEDIEGVPVALPEERDEWDKRGDSEGERVDSWEREGAGDKEEVGDKEEWPLVREEGEGVKELNNEGVAKDALGEKEEAGEGEKEDDGERESVRPPESVLDEVPDFVRVGPPLVLG
jgi:hypothetical protein